MADVQAQLEQLRQAMAVLEAQRATLGDAVVDPTLARLRQHLTALEAQLPAEPAPPEERRVITILFTDIVGSTTLAEQLDPEEWRQTVAAVHATVGGIIEQHPARQRGDYREAVRAAEDAVAAARRAGTLMIEARALAEKTFAQTRLGDMSAARVAAEEALARAQESKDEPTLAFTLSRVGIYYSESDDPARGAQLRLQQIAIDHRLGNREQEARGLMNLG